MLIDKLIKHVEVLKLNLKDKVILTEAASGAYVVTPILAGIAGAKVYAYTKNSPYGTVKEVVENTTKIIESYHTSQLNINFIETLTPDIIAEADIITNSGHLRPLNKEKLKYAKDSLVIPLMYEAWEWREADMDINYIKERRFKIGATNERHPDIDVFNYLGDMAVKLIFASGSCCYKNKFVLICNNDFGPYIAKVISKICSGLGIIDKKENRDLYNMENVTWLSNFPEINISSEFKSAEAIIFTAYPFDNPLLGVNMPVSATEIKNQFDNPFILRYAGDVDISSLDELGIKYYPDHVKSGHMGIIPSEIGYDPIIRLQAGGLKVAEALATGNYYHNKIRVLDLV